MHSRESAHEYAPFERSVAEAIVEQDRERNNGNAKYQYAPFPANVRDGWVLLGVFVAQSPALSVRVQKCADYPIM